MPLRNTSRVLDQQKPTTGSSAQITPRRLFTPLESGLLEYDPTHLVKFLNDATHDRPTIADADVVSAYLAVREFPSSLPDLRAEAYARISKHAGTEGLQQVMGALAEDVLTHFPRQSDPTGFSKSVTAILSHAISQCPLSNQRVLQLCEALVVSNDGTLPPLNPDVVQRIATAASSHPDAEIPPLDFLGSSLLLPDSQTDAERAKSTQMAYKFLMKVMLEGEESFPRALRLFQDLVETSRIPKRAQARASEEGRSFRTTVTIALVRACLWFEWRETAAELLIEMLGNPQWPHADGMTTIDAQVIASLACEVLRTLLPTTSMGAIGICRSLIMALLPNNSQTATTSSPPPVEIPQDILFHFYDSCYYCRTVAPAAHVYHRTQSSHIRQYQEYPPPRHAALFWLLDHFASPGISPTQKQRDDLEGRNYMARAMLEDILLKRHPVPLMDRPRLVSLAASRGWRAHTRKLWEMYTVEDDPNRDIVRGNAHMLVPVVRLFVKLQEIRDSRKNQSCTKQSNCGATSPSIEQSGSVDSPGDFWQFAEHVLRSYMQTKIPLASASQPDLNALARAQLILGHLPEGLDTLSHAMDRGDTPQIQDINVALAGLARYSPRRAANMIQHMFERGVEPSASTFSAVLHEALRDGDAQLVKRLINRAHEVGHGALTHKGIASIVRSSMAFEFTSSMEERLQQQQNVQWAMNAVETIMRHRKKRSNFSDHTKDHATSVSIGFHCARGSLKALQPQMAFRFWKLLIKERVLWDDREHKDLRAWIARGIRSQWRERQVSSNRATCVLEELRAPGVEADGPREEIRLAQ